nr:reverse transcriptase domain-containing protein [Tanacetum cinerariifolium]
MADHTMQELLHEPMEGYGEAIVIPEILAENFEIKTNLLQLVQTNKFYGFERDTPHTHIGNFKRMTSTLKYRDVPNDAIKLMLFLYSLEGAARIWDNSSKTDDRIDKPADQISNLVEIVNKQVIIPATAKAVEKTYVICGGAHAYYDCIATDSNQPSVSVATGTYNKVSPLNQGSNQIPPPGFAPVQNNQNKYNQNQRQGNNFNRRNMFQNNQGYRAPMNNALNFQNQGLQNQPFQASTSGTLPSNIMPNLKGKMKSITTRSGLAYEGPSIPTNSPLEKVVERETEEITDYEHSNYQGSTTHIRPPVVPISIPEVNVLRTQHRPNIPYPSRPNDQKLRKKATNPMEKFFQIFHDLHFDISFADAILLMPKFSSTIKSLLTNKDKLFELAKVPLNENCSAMLLKKLHKKLGDSGKFFIPCDFPGIDVRHALADLADRLITRPKGVAEDVFVKVGKFHFPTDFVVVDFKADPRVPLILGRSFLRIGRALIDVYGEEITLRNQLSNLLRPHLLPLEKGDILYLEKLLNEDPFQLPLVDLKQAEETKAKSSIEEPPELELKELPSHLEYAFLEESNKLPVIIAKYLKDVEKDAH